MLRVTIFGHAPTDIRRKIDDEMAAQVKTYVSENDDYDLESFDVVNCRGDRADRVLARRRRHHSLLNDNPSSG